jgi:hypothetical protein
MELVRVEAVLARKRWRLLGIERDQRHEVGAAVAEDDEPFVLDTTKYESTFGAAGTPLSTAISATVAWYQNRNGTPRPPQERPAS